MIKICLFSLPLGTKTHTDTSTQMHNNTTLHVYIQIYIYIYTNTSYSSAVNIQLNSGKIVLLSAQKAIKIHLRICWRKLFESIRSIRVFYPLAIPIKFSSIIPFSLNLLISSFPLFSFFAHYPTTCLHLSNKSKWQVRFFWFVFFTFTESFYRYRIYWELKRWK